LNKYFLASLDTVSKIITGLVSPIFTLFPIILFFALRAQPNQNYIPYFIGVTLLLWVIFAYCVLFWVKGYTITGEHLIINRVWKDKTILLQDLKSAESITKSDMGLVLRYLGNGGVFGYTGFFSNKQYGRMEWFVTSQEKLIVIELHNQKIICISPDDTADFIKTLKKTM
jgi:Bacterial PH domain